MVMHGRKYPRLNDGYYERSQSHPFENKYSHNDRTRYTETKNSPSLSRSRSDTSNVNHKPTQQLKPTVLPDRNSTSRYEKDRRVNNQSSQHRSDNRRSNHDRSHEASGRDKERNHKLDIQKSALLICGDWSEHKSSSGKRYFYNCKTEVSQWEKPKQWNDSKAVPPRGKVTKQAHLASKGIDDRSRHVGSSTLDYRNGSKPSSRSSTTTRDHKLEAASTGSYQKSRSDPSKQHSRRGRDGGYPDGLAKKHPTMGHGSTATFNGVKHSSKPDGEEHQQTEDMDISPDQSPAQHHNSSVAAPSSSHYQQQNLLSSSLSRHQQNASSSGAVSQQRHHRSSTSGTSVAAAVLPANSSDATLVMAAQLAGGAPSASTHVPGGNVSDSQELTQQAIQTIMKLQQAILAQQQQQLKAMADQQQRHRQTVLEQRKLEPDPELMEQAQQQASVALASSGLTAGGGEGGRNASGGDTPASHISQKSDGEDDSASCSSSQRQTSAPICDTSQQPHEALPQLTPSLGRYYKDTLIDHVSCWQGDQIDRQANMYRQESHTVGSLHCTQVSVDLKRQRSYVRINEIETTLQDQRVLFLAQQIKELENMRSQASFLPMQQHLQPPCGTPARSTPAHELEDSDVHEEGSTPTRDEVEDHANMESMLHCDTDRVSGGDIPMTAEDGHHPSDSNVTVDTNGLPAKQFNHKTSNEHLNSCSDVEGDGSGVECDRGGGGGVGREARNNGELLDSSMESNDQMCVDANYRQDNDSLRRQTHNNEWCESGAESDRTPTRDEKDDMPQSDAEVEEGQLSDDSSTKENDEPHRIHSRSNHDHFTHDSRRVVSTQELTEVIESEEEGELSDGSSRDCDRHPPTTYRTVR